MPLIDVNTTTDFESQITKKPYTVIHFWADWCTPCTDIDKFLLQLESQLNNDSLQFLRVEAEHLSDITEKYAIESVPAFVFLNNDRQVAKIEGANPQLVVKQIQQLIQAKPASTISSAQTTQKVIDFQALVTRSPIMLFMKGSPDVPKCGFSRQMVDLLKQQKVPFGTFDILADETVREGLKKFSNWPTYPQLYSNGKLIGGLDIVKELISDGSLYDELEYTPPKEVPLEERLKQLLNRAPIMLFMKGSPDVPKCGFSRQMVELLKQQKVTFDTFDILTDESVREGLKKYSNWPTYPQLYSKGSLVGGLDVVKELIEGDEFLEALE